MTQEMALQEAKSWHSKSQENQLQELATAGFELDYYHVLALESNGALLEQALLPLGKMRPRLSADLP